MHLTKIIPTVFTKEIKSISVLRSDSTDVLPIIRRHLPDGTFDLIINLGDPIHAIDDFGTESKLPTNIFVGGRKNSFCLQYPSKVHLISVIFQPGYASSFVKESLLELLTTPFIEAELVFGNRVGVLAEELKDSRCDSRTRDLLESFLLAHFSFKKSHYNPRILHAFSLLGGRFGDLSRIANEVCMSERNFRRVFKTSTGYSPQEVIRIQRTKRAAYLLRNGFSVLQTARQLSYHDSSHLSHEFRSVVGRSSLTFIRELTYIDDIFIESSQYNAPLC